MTVPTPNGPIYLRGLQDFVTVKGGEYFFLPSKLAIAALCWNTPGPRPMSRNECSELTVGAKAEERSCELGERSLQV